MLVGAAHQLFRGPRHVQVTRQARIGHVPRVADARAFAQAIDHLSAARKIAGAAQLMHVIERCAPGSAARVVGPRGPAGDTGLRRAEASVTVGLVIDVGRARGTGLQCRGAALQFVVTDAARVRWVRRVPRIGRWGYRVRSSSFDAAGSHELAVIDVVPLRIERFALRTVILAVASLPHPERRIIGSHAPPSPFRGSASSYWQTTR